MFCINIFMLILFSHYVQRKHNWSALHFPNSVVGLHKHNFYETRLKKQTVQFPVMRTDCYTASLIDCGLTCDWWCHLNDVINVVALRVKKLDEETWSCNETKNLWSQLRFPSVCCTNTLHTDMCESGECHGTICTFSSCLFCLRVTCQH